MGHTLSLEWDAIWRILIISLILGSGLPALFAFGIRAMAWGTGGSAEVDVSAAPHPVGRAVAFLCFAIVVVVVALGIIYIVATGFGKVLDFSTIYPTIHDK